jgi:hypothetical protein
MVKKVSSGWMKCLRNTPRFRDTAQSTRGRGSAGSLAQYCSSAQPITRVPIQDWHGVTHL